MKTAIVYDRVNKWGGAERVLLTLHELFPDAPLYTTVYDKENASWASVFDHPTGAGIKTSFLQHIPFAKSNHELYPWASAIAFEQFSFDQFDLVISVTSAEAKGIITKPGTTHICYCLTPTRYLWSHHDQYFSSGVFRTITAPLVNHMKRWDKVASSRPDHYIAISTAVAERIKKYYGRGSEVVYPPVDLKLDIRSSKVDKEVRLIDSLKKNQNIQLQISDIKSLTSNFQPLSPYFLIVSRLVPYKKIDLAIEVFNELGLPLVIVGKGRDENRLKNMAADNISFAHDLTDETLSCYYENSCGFVMLQEEDFGLSAVEAQLHGVPVIAYEKGGARDTVVNGTTGILFSKQAKEAVKNAIIEFTAIKFNKEDCIKNAQRFSKERFKKKFMEHITHSMKQVKVRTQV